MAKRGIVCLALLLSACRLINPPPGPGALDCQAVARSLTPRGRLAAMISLHAHAFGGPGHVPVVGLSHAVTVIECDFQKGGAGARSRKRRAVAELAGFGRLEDFETPLKMLGADLDTIRREVRARYPWTYSYLLRHPTVLEMVVSNLIAENPPLGGLASLAPPPSADAPGVCAADDVVLPTPPAFDPGASDTCDWKQEEPFVVWHVGPEITVDGKISLALSPTTVERNIDPQRWDDCSKFWDPPPQATRIVKKLAGGGYQEVAYPPAPGSDYGFATLFEHFSCNATGCLAWFKNLLEVKNLHMSSMPMQPSVSGYFVSYGLPMGDNLGGCVGSTDPNCAGGVPVAVDTDRGWLEAYVDQKRTVVVTHKEVKFDNAVANGITQALFTYAELARELAEVACCLKAGES